MLHHWQPARVRDVRRHLPAKRALAHRLQAGAKSPENFGLTQLKELFAKALYVAKDLIVKKADEAEQLEQRVLQGCCRQQQLGAWAKACLSVLAMMLAGL